MKAYLINQDDLSVLVEDLKTIVRNEMSSFTKSKAEEKPIGTKEAAKFLGIHINTVYVYMKSGMPFYEKNGLYFFYESELNDWIKKGK